MQGKELIVKTKLETEYTEIQQDPLKTIIVLYGEPGIGKTTMASQMENPYFLCTERGHSFVRVIGKRVINWRTFEEQVRALVAEEHPYKTVVVDTLTALWDMCVSDICHQNGWPHISEGGHGRGYDLAKTQFSNAMSALAGAGTGLVLIAHEMLKESEYLGVEREMYRPAVIPSCWRVVNPMADLVGRMFVKGAMVNGKPVEKRHISFAPAVRYLAKDRSGVLSAVGPIEVEPKEECWAKVAKIFKEKQK